MADGINYLGLIGLFACNKNVLLFYFTFLTLGDEGHGTPLYTEHTTRNFKRK